jgi:hypothetical protein
MSSQLSEKKLKNLLSKELKFKETGISVESDNVDPTVTIVEAKKGSLFLSSLNGKLYQKQTDDLDLNWIEIEAGPGGVSAVTSVNTQTGDVVLTKSDLSLGNVDNVSDVNKPVSTAQATADAAVQVYAIQRSHHTGTQTAATISDFNSVASIAAPVQSVAGQTGTVVLTKADVSLNNVDNVSDLNKPISTATQTALNLKASAADLTTHVNDVANPHAVTKTQVGLSNVQNVDQTNPANITQDATHRFVSDTEKSTWNGKQSALGFTPENIANKGMADGYAPLNASTLIDAIYLPSYVDDVLEFANLASLPVTGETAKIYVTLDTNKTYRWSGSAYIEISPSPGTTDSLTEGSVNLYFTAARAKSAAVADAINDGVIDVAPSQNAVFDALGLKANLSGAIFTGSISATNLSGTNTGDQNLAPYALLSGAIFTGTISATNFSGSSSGTNTGDQNLAPYALLASPTFTGTPLAPTATAGTNTTQIATTAFVTTAISGIPTSANTTLSNLGTTAINATLLSAADNTIDIGSSTNYFANTYSKLITTNGSINPDQISAATPRDIGNLFAFQRIRASRFSPDLATYTLTGDFTSGSNSITNVTGTIPASIATGNYSVFANGYTTRQNGSSLDGAVSQVNSVSGTTFTMSNQALATGTGITFTLVPTVTVRTEDGSSVHSGIATFGSGNATTLQSGHSILKSGTVSTGRSGDVVITSGNASGAGTSGNVILNVGTTSGGTTGKIRFTDSSQGTIGHVWTSTDTRGGGAWAAPSGGGSSYSVSTKTANYTILTTDTHVVGDASSGAFTFTFPAASTATNKLITVKKSDSSFNAITLSGTGMTINYLMTIGETAVFISDGTSWIQVNRITDTPWIAYSPTVSSALTSPSDEGNFWRRRGSSIDIKGVFSYAGGTSNQFSYGLPNPSGWQMDATVMSIATNANSHGVVYGTSNSGNFPNSGQGPLPLFSDTAVSTSLLYIADTNSSSRFSKSAGTGTLIGGNTRLRFDASGIPMVNFSV